ncbi:DNA-binding MarR family transcriptional regulator [Paraburkholderia sp. GAS348]
MAAGINTGFVTRVVGRLERQGHVYPARDSSDWWLTHRQLKLVVELTYRKQDRAMRHYTIEGFSLTQSVAVMLARARYLIIAEMDAALKDLDITTPQMGILFAMQRGLASTPFEISKVLSVDTGLMTRMLDKLEAKGLLERSRRMDDRRMVDLVLTKKGGEVTAEIPMIAPEVLNARLKKFTTTEFEELGRLLQKFMEE